MVSKSSRYASRRLEIGRGGIKMEDENLIENTELVEYTDESIDDELQMEGVEE